MLQKDIISLLKRVILFLILFFVVFVIFINLMKFVDYINKINNIIKTMDDNSDIKPVTSEVNDTDSITENSSDIYEKHTAEELGYVNDLYRINGSEWGEGINILLVGSDKYTYFDGKSHADVIIVLRITTSGRMLSISIPRDSIITIKDGVWANTKDKIGHSYYWNGLDNLKKDVEYLIGSPIYKVAIIDNFKAFEAFLAIMGGVDLDKELYGKTGVQWIRNRHFKDGDIERCRRQQLFLKKSIVKMWDIIRNGNYIYSKLMYNAFTKILKTNITQNEFMNIIYLLKINGFNPKKDCFIGVLPGSFSKYNSVLMKRNNLTCWILDEDMLKKLQFLFYSEDKSYERFITKEINLKDFIKADCKLFKK